MEAMERLMCGRTTFLIAHRLSTLAACNLRLEVEDGRVVQVTSAAPVRSQESGIRSQESATGAVSDFEHVELSPVCKTELLTPDT